MPIYLTLGLLIAMLFLFVGYTIWETNYIKRNEKKKK